LRGSRANHPVDTTATKASLPAHASPSWRPFLSRWPPRLTYVIFGKKMKCPNCNGDLIRGETFFKKSISDLMAFGLGAEDLRMKREDGVEILLLSSSEKAATQFCPECGVAVIATGMGKRPAARKV
jgi:predicted RNA-binding Zn-ribbon protein involved in translation (DUF1610 family)